MNRFGEVEVDGMTFLLLDEPKPCFECGKPTILIEVSFEGPVHVDCANEAWRYMIDTACLMLAPLPRREDIFA